MAPSSQSLPNREILSGFPENDYTPHGYLDNPYHSMVFNRSGVIRSVPPLGFGWWRRKFKGSYGEGIQGHVNYLSLLQISIRLGDQVLITDQDFTRQQVALSSRYHTKNMQSYDFEYQHLNFNLKFFLIGEHSLACLVQVTNTHDQPLTPMIYATNIYGAWETPWWGSNGLTTRHVAENDLMISKIWAYGDIFVLGANQSSFTQAAFATEQKWEHGLREAETPGSSSCVIRGKGPIYATQVYSLLTPAGKSTEFLITLSRGPNETRTIDTWQTAQKTVCEVLPQKLLEDDQFWTQCPQLVGDWPQSWQHGWIYDWETLRMNVRQPIGIYRHPWDAMQVHSPRAVLGESSLDMMTLSYAAPDLACEVLAGTFSDAPAPNIPCSREDGSMNMIGNDGSECGTSPVWGLPFHVIGSIFNRTQNREWLQQLYPYLKAFLEWWLANRTDAEGWFHCNNSWESGQDGSKRFLVTEHDEGAVASFVRTVDVEAVMAQAMSNMMYFAEIAKQPNDIACWRELAERRITSTRQMFVDGWFRDFNVRTDRPIILPDYVDIMMLIPVACGIATPEQLELLKPKFDYFKNHPRIWLEWPSFIFPFCEAAWNCGLYEFTADLLAEIADRVYTRTDARTLLHVDAAVPFSYRIPGVANEYWPVDPIPAGGENYGWGATLPMDFIRNIIGFRESSPRQHFEFLLTPNLPGRCLTPGKSFGIKNLHFRELLFSLTYTVRSTELLAVGLNYTLPEPKRLAIYRAHGELIFQETQPRKQGAVIVVVPNRASLTIQFQE